MIKPPSPARLFALMMASLTLSAAASSTSAPPKTNATLDTVRRAGSLTCGVVTEPGDFTKDDTHGNTAMFGADVCRAVAASVLGDASHVQLDGFPDEAHAYRALQGGKVALVVGVSPRPALASRYDVAFGAPVFFDRQGFLVEKQAGIATLSDLSGKTLCFIGSTDAETSAHEALERRGIRFLPFPFEEMGEMEAALVSGHCQAETHDVTTLAAGRSNFHGRTGDFIILPETVTLDALVPAMRAGDDGWARVVDWTMYALVQAEISGVTRENVAALRLPLTAPAGQPSSEFGDITVATLLGRRPGLGYSLGLADDWAVKAISAVGNYGEMFERDFGRSSSYRLERGPNRPSTQGGLLWVPQFR